MTREQVLTQDGYDNQERPTCDQYEPDPGCDCCTINCKNDADVVYVHDAPKNPSGYFTVYLCCKHDQAKNRPTAKILERFEL